MHWWGDEQQAGAGCTEGSFTAKGLLAPLGLQFFLDYGSSWTMVLFLLLLLSTKQASFTWLFLTPCSPSSDPPLPPLRMLSCTL